MKKKILVCEDDAGVAEVVKLMLEDEGYDVTMLSKGKDVVKFVSKNLPDLLLLDVLMSGMDGRELTKVLRRNKMTESIPIILISATSDLEKTAQDLGADDYISKPFKMETLFKVIRRNLNDGKA